MQTSLSPHVNPAADSEPGYGQLFAVLIRRFPWFLLVFMASVGAGYYVYRKTPPTYKSSMELLVEPNYQGKAQGTGEENQFIESNVEIKTETQLELMDKSSLIKQAVEKLEPEYPDLTVKDVQNGLTSKEIRSEESNVATNIFQIEYADRDPQKTKRVLEALQQVYLDFNKEQQKKRLQKGLKVVRDQKKKETEKLSQAERKLQSFRELYNLTDPQTQAQANENALNNIQQERRTTHNQYKEAQAKIRSLQQQLKRTPQKALVSSRLSQSSRYQSLLNEIQKTELAIAQANLRFTESHPDVLKLKQQLAEQKQLLRQEVGRALGGSNVDTSAVNTGELLNQGQLSQTDLNLASTLVETQTELFALAARDQSLAQKEEQLNKDLKKFPTLLAQYNRLQPQVTRSRDSLQE
ncbi:MAG: capsular biosynthesis protein, partial [Cyanobacteria bacterium J06636_27]